MRRREFIRLLGGASAWPLAARAQQSAMPVIGFLDAGSPESMAHLVAAFRKWLSETGYVEGRNVTIEYRWAQNDINRLPELAADLVRRQVAVIAAKDTPSAIAAKAANTTIPIVFATGSDPVKLGLVASLNQPGGNVTGVSFLSASMSAKVLGLLHELLPGALRIAVLVDPNFPTTEPFVFRHPGYGFGYWEANRSPLRQHQSRHQYGLCEPALLVGPGPFFYDRRVQLVTLAAHQRVPAIYLRRETAEAGGLMSYGTSITDAHRQVGVYTGRILKGEKPADLPVMQSTKFEFVINLITAKALGIKLSDTR